jgi:monoamine oxidase
LFDIPPARLESLLAAYYCHDWEADPCSLGAYSYAPAGALDASGRIAEPVENTLFFAGEHPDVGGHWGTVHGALASGDSAARRLLAAGRGAAADVDPG